MIKVFLVEDEKIIRKSIKNNVKWEENGFQILAGLDIFTAKAGQVFYNDAVRLLFTDSVHNAAKARPVIVGAGVTVVYLLPHQRDLRVPLHELVDQFSLVVDTLALIALAQL